MPVPSSRATTDAAVLGVIMLDTRFPRLVGDIGNPDTFSFSVQYAVVPRAWVGAVVTGDKPNEVLVAAFVEAARDLESRGVRLIATSCGFLGSVQPELSRSVRIPVVTSALMLIPFLRGILGATVPIAVLTFDARKLLPVHFAGHYDENLVIEGLERGRELYPVIAGDRPVLDPDAAGQDVVEAVMRLLTRSPRLAAIVLECTNLGPYRDRIRALTPVPVLGISDAVDLMMGK